MRYALLVLCLIPWLPVHAPEPELLASRTAPYFEDERGGRVVAEIQAELHATPRGVELSGRIRATGDLVDPVPGFSGIRGGNRITAREMTTLHDERALALTDAAGHPAGTIRAARRGRIAERHVRADGTLDHDAHSEPLLVELRFDAGPFTEGEHEVFLRVHEVPRLRIAFTITGEGAEITALAGRHDDAR